MSLLYRIAISQGDQTRKTVANETIAALEQHKVADWNRKLQNEISKKAKDCSFGLTPGVKR